MHPEQSGDGSFAGLQQTPVRIGARPFSFLCVSYNQIANVRWNYGNSMCTQVCSSQETLGHFQVKRTHQRDCIDEAAAYRQDIMARGFRPHRRRNCVSLQLPNGGLEIFG